MNAIRTFVLCLCLIAVVFISPSCYKEPLHPVTKQYILMDSFCRDYFDSYRQGSQWIYQIQGTNQIDTTTETTFLRIYQNDDSLLLTDYIERYYEGDYNAYQSKLVPIYYSLVATGKNSCFWGLMYQFGAGMCIVESHGSFSQPQGTPGPTNGAIIDTFPVLNHVFYNVLHLSCSWDNQYQDVYFAKNIGIVEKRRGAQVFLLKTWNVNH